MSIIRPSGETSDILSFPATELARLIKTRELSAKELISASLVRATAADDRFNAFTQIFRDESLAVAETADKAIASGKATGPLFGVPSSIKDFTPTKNQQTQARANQGGAHRPTRPPTDKTSSQTTST